MNKQEIFDTVVRALRKQGQPSAVPGHCLYRSVKEGKVLKCAAGHLIPDEEYDPSWEGKGSHFVPYLQQAFRDDVRWLIRDLQSAHDQEMVDVSLDEDKPIPAKEEWLAEFLKRAADVARYYDLDPSVITEDLDA